MEQDEILTTFDVARHLQVHHNSVVSWVESGKLKGYKTPGGHRRIRLEDLLDFLRRYGIPQPESLNGASISILIVDDETGIRGVIKRIIAKAIPKARVQEAGDGFEAGLLAAEMRPALIILDIRLPGVDGFEVCQRIRRDESLKSTKILAMTGYDSDEVRRKIKACGADDYLPKPFEAKEIEKRILALCGVFP